ncbi:calmodulin-binding protein 25-like [Andrographis paniculata]|uniref:calmodulin-binding protein 25-like n=1 Tax=Andrographis paniculata TaxID=175694 RepID=UPI0021E6ED7A|nr:calmodulin-binding protein 25-like [Andrographis paniculata]
MASFDNFMAVEQPWMIRPEIFSDGALTTSSFYGGVASDSSYGSSYVLSDELLECIFAKPDATSFQTQTPSASDVGSEKEAAVVSAASKQRRRSGAVVPPPTGKVSKRKSRAKKKSAKTTFLSADPANFMQMVQQVTGGNFGGGAGEAVAAAAAWNPVAVNPLGGLATLDTSSAFLTDGSVSQLSGDGGGVAAPEPYVDSFCIFPTLESWKAT